MATVYTPGGRRSAGLNVTPQAARPSYALNYNPQVVRQLVGSFQSGSEPTVSVGQGGSRSSSGYTFNGSADSSTPAGGFNPRTIGQIGGLLGAAGAATQNADLANMGAKVGQVGTLASIAAGLQSGDTGNITRALAPTALRSIGVPGFLASAGMTAMDPRAKAGDVAAASLSGLAYTAMPALALVDSALALFGATPMMQTLGDTFRSPVNSMANPAPGIAAPDQTPAPATATYTQTDGFTADYGFSSGNSNLPSMGGGQGLAGGNYGGGSGGNYGGGYGFGGGGNLGSMGGGQGISDRGGAFGSGLGSRL